MSQISKAALLVENNQSFPDNNTGYITPDKLRGFNVNLIDSTVNQTTYSADIAEIQSDIAALEAFTASQQPSFAALNAFTASASSSIKAINQFTQSAQQELDSLSAWTGSWEAWTSSINEIRDDGVLQGYSTRFFFNGLVSASIVQNVGGPIANVTVESDGTKLGTASFNDYVASTNTWTASAKVSITNINAFTASNGNTQLNQYTASQDIINASVTASLSELLALSSSLSGGYATQGELDASASALQANIDTKLSTASFEAYTSSFSQSVATAFSQSYAVINALSSSSDTLISSSVAALSASVSASEGVINGRIDTLSSLTGSYATTGSNTFIGTEIITGSIVITGSAYGNVVSASVVSGTASIDLTAGNYFTLRLPANTNTWISLVNPQPGVTATLVIDTDATSSVSFSANVKQPSASAYIPSPSGNVDILSFTAVTTGTVYVVPAFAFV